MGPIRVHAPPESEKGLASAVGDLSARERLINHFLPLDRRRASRYRHSGEAQNNLGDPQQFSLAYDEHAGAMTGVAHSVLRDAAAAEDVVQDVFVHLWRRPGAYDPARGSLGSYLTMMARSRALDRWRTRSARESALERSKAEQRVLGPVAEDAAAPVIRREGRIRVLRALDALPGEQREAVLLAFGKGLTAREIASVAGVPLGTVKNRVRLGLQKARAELAAAD